MLLRHVSAQIPKHCRKGIGYSSIETYREALEIAMLIAKREENATRIDFSRMFSCVNVRWPRHKSIEQPRDEMVVWTWPNDAKTVCNAIIAHNLEVEFDNCQTGTLPFSTMVFVSGSSPYSSSKACPILSSHALSLILLYQLFSKLTINLMHG